jgi:hypothetical protein
MSKINQIQRRLSEIEGGLFQKLAEAYIYKKGYENVNSIGSLVGSDKSRKGTPDSFFPQPNGKFIFAEYTTQQIGLYDKTLDDLTKCLKKDLTGVPTAKIQEIVFCNTGRLSVDEIDKLTKESQKGRVVLSVFGIDTISFDLYLKYPGLTRDFLGIKVDTGQIVTIQDFIAAYEKSPLSTPLSTKFHFREADLKRVLTNMEGDHLVILSGPPGVGKSRLALEACSAFRAQHPDYVVRCIYNRSLADLFEDLRVHFAEAGHYLIFVDDANRLTGLVYILQLLIEQSEQKRFKILMTVRDYALEHVRQASAPFDEARELTINGFSDTEIQQLVKDEYGISGDDFLERIADIAKGNARLAMMAANLAKHSDTLSSLIDVSSLYDQYFSSITADIQKLDSPHILESGAIISFFGVIDFNNRTLLIKIESAFGITPEVLLEASKELHQLEMVDMFENTVVKFSDQVVSTYLFYRVFFKLKTLSLKDLFENFFLQFSGRFVDTINPILNAFDYRTIIEILRVHIDRKWDQLLAAKDEDGLFLLMKSFWYVDESSALAHLKDMISEFVNEPKDLEDGKQIDRSSIPDGSLLTVLNLFSYSPNESSIHIAVELLCFYARKKPSETSQILYSLTEYYGLKHTSYRDGFAKQ